MAVHEPLDPARDQAAGAPPAPAGDSTSRLRIGAAFGIVLLGMTAIDGWATSSSLSWLGWLFVGLASGLVAGSSRATMLVAPATLLVYPLALLFDRVWGQWMPAVWAILVLIGGMVTAAGFAAGAALAQRKVAGSTVAAVLGGVLGLVVWTGLAAYLGSEEVVVASTSWPRCDTPGSMYGWAYEAVNYDPADDARFVVDTEGKCASQGTGAGTEVVSADGTRLAGWYIPAGNGANATAPTIIISPGWKSNKTEVLKYAPFFHDRFNLLLVDLRNEGRSSGESSSFGFNERQDIRAMVDWLETTKHPSWIGAMGNSMGAATVLGEAVDDPRIGALILDSMHATMLDTFGDGVSNERNLPALPAAWAIVGLSSMRAGVDIPAVDPVKTIGRMGDRPVLLIHGTADILDTVDHAAKPNLAAAQAAGVPVTIQYCEGGGHGGLVDKCPKQWQAWVDAFLASIPELQEAAR